MGRGMPRATRTPMNSFFSRPALALAFVAVLGAVSGACGGSSAPNANPVDGGVEASRDAAPVDAMVEDAPSDGEAGGIAPYPAFDDDPPQLLSAGGPTMNAPNIVPIFFANDPLQPQIEQFLTQLAASSYWPSTTSEYNVGSLTIAQSIVVADPIPATLTGDETQSWLATYLDGTHSEWPAVSTNNIYMLFTQSATTVSYGSSTSLQTQCTDFTGYHFEASLNEADAGIDAGNAAFAFAVLPRCPAMSPYTVMDVLTIAASHEAIEAATDPFPNSAPAYIACDLRHLVWEFIPFPEVGDMCNFEMSSNQRLVGNFMVQRIWSNVAAATGGDPCVPVPEGSIYFNATPDLEDSVPITIDGRTVMTGGVSVPVGQSKTINIRFFSSAPTTPWTVTLTDTSVAYDGPVLLSFSPNQITGNNGDVVPVTVTGVATSSIGGAEIILESFHPSDPKTINYWFGYVAE
jgi:hypothetical protein